ncbi:MAG: response regulator transcription factor [Sphingobacteriales bacterium]|nr:MAG: response regulator transcription factor [Sphingobacteriales bacterium]
MIKIGIAEDDIKIAELLQSALTENGYQVETVANGEQALDVFTGQHFDMLILDVMMPGLNGHQVCQRIRSSNEHIPILMLTALGMVDDKVSGFDAGADDYLVKPFHLKELLARISALLRRQMPSVKENTHIVQYEDLRIDTESKEVYRGNLEIQLSAKEYVLLELFLRNPGKLLSRQFIAEQAWNINFDTGTNVIDVYVNFLRKKIDKGFERKLIHTKINMGYILK